MCVSHLRVHKEPYRFIKSLFFTNACKYVPLLVVTCKSVPSLLIISFAILNSASPYAILQGAIQEKFVKQAALVY